LPVEEDRNPHRIQGNADCIGQELTRSIHHKQHVAAGQLSIHADRGSPMVAKPVAFMRAELAKAEV